MPRKRPGRPIPSSERAAIPMSKLPGRIRQVIRSDYGGSSNPVDYLKGDFAKHVAKSGHAATDAGLTLGAEWAKAVIEKQGAGSRDRAEHNLAELETRTEQIRDAHAILSRICAGLLDKVDTITREQVKYTLLAANDAITTIGHAVNGKPESDNAPVL